MQNSKSLKRKAKDYKLTAKTRNTRRNNMSENTTTTPRPVRINETILRDAHQSLIATRMPTEVMLPILDTMDKVGYHSVEMWGGATFDSCLRFLKEDPWERLRKIKKGLPNTKLQMLFRGQNILGYSHYSDDVVEYFAQKSVANGIDIVRIFDCLNDLRNLETCVKATKKENGHAQIALSYTLGDAGCPGGAEYIDSNDRPVQCPVFRGSAEYVHVPDDTAFYDAVSYIA